MSASPTAQSKSALALARLYFENQNHIAGCIHDGLVQYVVGAKMWLESIEAELLDDDGKVAVKTIHNALSDGVQDARQLIRSLRHESASTEGLAQKLTESVARYQSSVDHKVELSINGDFAEIDDDLQFVVACLIDELLHLSLTTQAAILGILAERRDTHLEIELRANAWADPEQALQSLLILMRAVGGELSIDVEPSGTTLTAKFPII